MRPIVSFCGSPTYQLSKYLTTILQPLTDKSRRKLQSTEDFINATKTVQIPEDYKSLFTSIPLQLALQCTDRYRQRTFMDLLKLCLTSTYFQYNNKHHKQLHGKAMGSPVSVVVAYPTRTSTLTVLFQRTTIAKTSFDETLTDLLLLPKLTTTQFLWLQQLYRT